MCSALQGGKWARRSGSGWAAAVRWPAAQLSRRACAVCDIVNTSRAWSRWRRQFQIQIWPSRGFGGSWIANCRCKRASFRVVPSRGGYGCGYPGPCAAAASNRLDQKLQPQRPTDDYGQSCQTCRQSSDESVAAAPQLRVTCLPLLLRRGQVPVHDGSGLQPQSPPEEPSLLLLSLTFPASDPCSSPAARERTAKPQRRINNAGADPSTMSEADLEEVSSASSDVARIQSGRF